MWAAKSLLHCRSKFCFISSSDLPIGGPEALNTHAQSEQPQRPKGSSSIQTSFRLMASLAHFLIWSGCALAKDGLPLVFKRNCDEENRPFAGVLAELPRGLWRLPIAEGCCLWGIQHWQELLSQSEVVLELVNDAIAFTGGFFEFPATHNLHCAGHIVYNALFLEC
jgi:hypothetical protein